MRFRRSGVRRIEPNLNGQTSLGLSSPRPCVAVLASHPLSEVCWRGIFLIPFAERGSQEAPVSPRIVAELRKMESSLKIAALLCVKDEIELITHTISHLRAIGVDFIIACDVNSTDGTKEVLESYRSTDFFVTHVNDLNPDPTEFQRGYDAAVAAAAAARADWLLFQDADECWIPATGNLKECIALENAELLSVDRFHVPVSQGVTRTPPFSPDYYDRLLLVVKSVPNFREFMRENPTAPWILGVPVPKVMVRPRFVASIKQAGHDAVPAAGVQFRRARPADLLIAHLPFTTAERFARKVKNIRRNMQVHDNTYRGTVAWHWRRWIELADKEGIYAEFERSSLDPKTIESLRQNGFVQSAAEIFYDRRVQPGNHLAALEHAKR
jgi:Glycosyl transferase family 2